MNLQQLTAKREALKLRSFAIMDQSEGRAMTVEEKREYQDAIIAMDRVSDEIRAAELAQGGRPIAWGMEGLAVATSGQELRSGDRVADWVRAQPNRPERERPLSLGLTFRGIVTGRWDGAEAERDAISYGGTGGMILDDELSAEVVDIARAAAVTQQLGAVTRPITKSEGWLPVVESEGTPVWHLENVSESSLAMEFGRRRIAPKTLMGLYRGSVEMFEDSDPVDLGELIRNSLGRTLALELDRASLRGTGAGAEPLGIRYSTAGSDPVTITELGSGNGQAISLDAISEGASTIAGFNHMPGGFALSVRDDGGLARTKTGDGQYFARSMWPANIAQFRTAATTAIPTNLTVGTSTDCAELYLGQWDQLMIAMRTNLQVEIFRAGDVDSVSLVSSMGVAIRAYLRADVVLKRGTAFNVLTGVRPA